MCTDVIEVLASRSPQSQKEDGVLGLEFHDGKARGTCQIIQKFRDESCG